MVKLYLFSGRNILTGLPHEKNRRTGGGIAIASGFKSQTYFFGTRNFTTVLNQAYSPIKDNRLPPIAFTTSYSAYDTVLIAGNALYDPDFNLSNGVESNGADKVFYHIPMNDYFGTLTVTLNIQYQTILPRWLNDMFSDETPEINLFKQMVEDADLSPILVTGVTLEIGIINDVK